MHNTGLLIHIHSHFAFSDTPLFCYEQQHLAEDHRQVIGWPEDDDQLLRKEKHRRTRFCYVKKHNKMMRSREIETRKEKKYESWTCGITALLHECAINKIDWRHQCHVLNDGL